MLIVLPPSEGKTAPSDGPVLDLAALSFPRLTQVRDQVSRALVRLAGTRRAAEVLGLGPTQADAVETDARLFEVPCAPAGEVYTGVLFGELDPMLAERVGDVIAIARDTVVLASKVDPLTSRHIGQHGGLSDAEMLVPALIHRNG